jgi:hypothetical protein
VADPCDTSDGPRGRGATVRSPQCPAATLPATGSPHAVQRRSLCNRVPLSPSWRESTSHFLFEPIELLEKLAALIPRRGARALAGIRYGRPAPDGIACGSWRRPTSGVADYDMMPAAPCGVNAGGAGFKDLYGACFSGVVFRWGLGRKSSDVADENVIVAESTGSSSLRSGDQCPWKAGGQPPALGPQGNAVQGEAQVLAH